MAGVLLFQGMTAGFLPGDFTLSIGEDGAPHGEFALSTAYNVVPLWLRIAKDNLALAKAASTILAEQWDEDDEKRKNLLIAELAPSMQVCVTCGIALDALYDTLRPHANFSAEEIASWRKHRTGRGRQIATVISRVFRLDNYHSQEFTRGIQQVTKLRDLAAHPSLALKRACARPDIEVGVDWKFATYTYAHARVNYLSTATMLAHLCQRQGVVSQVGEAMSNILRALKELGVVEPAQNIEKQPDS